MVHFGYYQVAAASFPIKVAAVAENARQIIDIVNHSDDDLQLIVFGELSLCGYSCQDLFFEETLLDACQEGLLKIARECRENILIVAGVPVAHEGRLYNCAAFIFNHEILGFQAKGYLPNYNEFYEKRWFHSGFELLDKTVIIQGRPVPITTDLLIHDNFTEACVGAEICEDLWVPDPVSNHHFFHGANVICNLSAGDELIAKANFRRELVKTQSQKLACGYIYASGGHHESTADMLFSDQQLIYDNGRLLKEGNAEGVITATLDLEMAAHERRHYNSLLDQRRTEQPTVVTITSKPVACTFRQPVRPYPFVPSDPKKRCLEIMDIQAKALGVRLERLPSHRVVLGISGGLDSTLALLICARVYDLYHWDKKDITACVMPGFGTTDRTYQNAVRLISCLKATKKEISISDDVTSHLQALGHSLDVHDITYENAQARERTQILMDLANQVDGIVIGTGDLSEIALGWCTYNGDHMSMYGVNASIPKTLVSSLVLTYANTYANADLKAVLQAIVNTPISPELLPPDAEGKIVQKTESSIGAYRYHDFFLYYMIRYHFGPAKIYDLACRAFRDDDPKVILDTLKIFYRRFFAMQFKRDCVPDGIKVGSVALSPRADWRMPSDASRDLWQAELDRL